KNDVVRPALDKLAGQLGVDKEKVTLEEARAEKLRLEHLAGRIPVWWRAIKTSPAKAVLAILFIVTPIVLGALPAVFPAAMAETKRAVAALTAGLASILALASWIRSHAMPIAGMIDDALKKA